MLNKLNIILSKEYIGTSEALRLLNGILTKQDKDIIFVHDLIDFAKSSAVDTYFPSKELGISAKICLAHPYLEIVSGKHNICIRSSKEKSFSIMAYRDIVMPLTINEGAEILFEYLDKDNNQASWPFEGIEKQDFQDKEISVVFKPKDIQNLAYKIKDMEPPSEELIQKLQNQINSLTEENFQLQHQNICAMDRIDELETHHKTANSVIVQQPQKEQLSIVEQSKNTERTGQDFIRAALAQHYPDGEAGFWHDIVAKAAAGDIFAASLLAEHLYSQHKTRGLV